MNADLAHRNLSKDYLFPITLYKFTNTLEFLAFWIGSLKIINMEQVHSKTTTELLGVTKQF